MVATRAGVAGLRLPEKWTPELAHYLGWLLGDGCISGTVVTTVYGTDVEQREILPRHQALLAEINGGRVPKPSVQANGTVQLRIARGAVVRFLESLGVTSGKAAAKVVPWAMYEAPTEIVAAFLRGLYDADGCVYDGAKHRYVGLGSVSVDLLLGVQRLLTTFGIASRRYETRRAADTEFVHVDKKGTFHVYEGGQLHDLRVSSGSMATFAERGRLRAPGEGLQAGWRARRGCVLPAVGEGAARRSTRRWRRAHLQPE